MGCGASSQPAPDTLDMPVEQKRKHDVNKLIEYGSIMAVHSNALKEMDLSPEESEIVKDLAQKELSRVQKPEFTDMLTFPAQTGQLAVATGGIERGRIECALTMHRSGMKAKSAPANDCFDKAIVDFRREVVLRSTTFKMDDTGIGLLVDRLFEMVDTDNNGSLDQSEVAATVQLLKKWSEAGQAEGWDSKQNMSEMLRPAWILLGNKKAEPDEAKRKVPLHNVLKLISTIFECVVDTSVSVEEIWGLSVPKAMPKASEGLFELFAATEYDIDKNKTLGFDEAIKALESSGLLAELDGVINKSKEKKKRMENNTHLITGNEESQGLFSEFAKNMMDAQSAEKLVPKMKAHLEAMKDTSPSAMSVLKSVAAGGITQEVFIEHVLKATEENAEYQNDLMQHILEDVVTPAIRAQSSSTAQSAEAEAIVTKAQTAFVNLKSQMVNENQQLVIALAKATFALVDINGDGKISMSEIDTFKQLDLGEEDMDAKKLMTTLLTIMDKDGNREIDMKELEGVLLRLYTFVSRASFGLQRYTSKWICKMLADEAFATVISDCALLTVKTKGDQTMLATCQRLAAGVTVVEAVDVYEYTKTEGFKQQAGEAMSAAKRKAEDVHNKIETATDQLEDI